MRTSVIIAIGCTIVFTPIIAGIIFSYENHSGFFEEKQKEDLRQTDIFEIDPTFSYRDVLDPSKCILNANQNQIQIDFYTKTNGKYDEISRPQYAYQLIRGDDGYDHPDYSHPLYNGMIVYLHNETNPIYMAVTVKTTGIYIAPQSTASKSLNPDISNFTFDHVNDNLLGSWIFEINTTNIKNEAYKDLQLTDGATVPIRTYYIMYYPAGYNGTKQG